MTTPPPPEAAHTPNTTLASARVDLDTAAALDDDHRRRQYALAARDSAAEVLLDPASTDLECAHARDYFRRAHSVIIASGSPTHRETLTRRLVR